MSYGFHPISVCSRFGEPRSAPDFSSSHLSPTTQSCVYLCASLAQIDRVRQKGTEKIKPHKLCSRSHPIRCSAELSNRNHPVMALPPRAPSSPRLPCSSALALASCSSRRTASPPARRGQSITRSSSEGHYSMALRITAFVSCNDKRLHGGGSLRSVSKDISK